MQELNVRQALAALRERRFMPSRYVSELLAWQARWPTLNAYTAQDLEAVRAAAREADRRQDSGAAGLLNGLPVAVKDNIDCVGYATTGGTPGLLGNRPRATAPVLRACLDEGAVMMGKTGLHELAAGGTCASLMFGSIRNPYNLAMVPGGSSGGSAAAVAARLVPAALGTDTAGSIRAPASHCGCVGFRPTTGRYRTAGMVPGASRRDTMGWLARTVADIELLDRISGTNATPARITSLRGVLLGVPRPYFYESLHPEVAAVIEQTLRRLERAGAQLLDVEVPEVGPKTQAITAALRAEFPQDLGAYLRDGGSGITVEQVTANIADPVLKQVFARRRDAGERARPESAGELSRAIEGFRKLYAELFARTACAALVLPTCPEPPYPVPQDPSLGGTGPVSMIRNTEPATLAALPSLSLPAGLTAHGLPVGIQIDGPSGSDLNVLKIGQLLEAITEPLPAPQPPV